MKAALRSNGLAWFPNNGVAVMSTNCSQLGWLFYPRLGRTRYEPTRMSGIAPCNGLYVKLGLIGLVLAGGTSGEQRHRPARLRRRDGESRQERASQGDSCTQRAMSHRRRRSPSRSSRSAIGRFWLVLNQLCIAANPCLGENAWLGLGNARVKR